MLFKKRILLCITLLIVATGCQGRDINKLEDDNNKLKAENISLNEKLILITQERDELKDIVGFDYDIEGECKFTKTFIVRDILEYDTNEETKKFVVLDQFQIFEPFIVKIDEEQVLKLSKGSSYEFKFSGKLKDRTNVNSLIFDKYKLNTLVSTEKQGSEQLQELCQ